MEKKLCLIRSPYQYKYSLLEPDEEPILTYLMGYLKSIGFLNFYVFDFHLVRNTTLDDLLRDEVTDYVLAVRETGENVHYVKRLSRKLHELTGKRIWVYGQVARLKRMSGWQHATLVHHSEPLLARELGLNPDGVDFKQGLTAMPYIQGLRLGKSMKKRAKAVLETTRGCHFGCKFCFINQGKNYDQRWQRRPNEAILADIQSYYRLGIRNFQFYDSEFLGSNASEYPEKVELLKAIRDRFSGIRFKIYCRGDTLLKFNQFQLLKEAGLAQVFIGVESLHQGDLDALNKGLKVEEVLAAIDRLKEKDIYSNLSFITFNRNTTIETLKKNFVEIEKLLQYKHHLIGVPAFTFAFESNWRTSGPIDGSEIHLSDKTYIRHDLRQKEQPEEAEIFNASLEALMEIYRLLSYEWSKKLTRLNISQDYLEGTDLDKVHSWFDGLCRFCLDTMQRYLAYFESGLLTLDTLSTYNKRLFEDIAHYYERLPEDLQQLETYDSHASTMDYVNDSEKVEEDEYWLENIPA